MVVWALSGDVDDLRTAPKGTRRPEDECKGSDARRCSSSGFGRCGSMDAVCSRGVSCATRGVSALSSDSRGVLFAFEEDVEEFERVCTDDGGVERASSESNMEVPSSEMGVIGHGDAPLLGADVLRMSGDDTERRLTSAIGMRFCGAPGGSSTERGRDMEAFRTRAAGLAGDWSVPSTLRFDKKNKRESLGLLACVSAGDVPSSSTDWRILGVLAVW